MPSGPFRPLLQSMIHPIITIKGWWDQCVQHSKPIPKKPAFGDIVPDSEKAHDLPIPVRILATVVAYSVKIEFGIKVSITGEAASYQVPEKFWTCVKGVKYYSGTQKARQSGMITPKLSKHSRKQAKESNSETQSSSSEEEEGDKEDIFAKVQPLQRKQKHGKRQWKKWTVTHLLNFTEVDQSTPSPSRPFTPPFPDCLNPAIFQIYLSWPTFNPFDLLSKFKKPH